jgi:hypothetical protein
MRDEKVTEICLPSPPLRKMSYEYDGQPYSEDRLHLANTARKR